MDSKSWTSSMMFGTTTRTTIAVPAGLLAATDRAVTLGKAKNLTEFHHSRKELAIPSTAFFSAGK
jgi:hypothetical protein